MKRTFAAVVTSLALLAAPAFAQIPAAVDPAAAAAVNDLLASMRFREVTAAALQQMEQSMPQQMRTVVTAQLGATPNMSAQEKQNTLAEADKAISRAIAAMHKLFSDPTLMAQIQAEMVPLYARTFTIDEIRQLTAFYSTPLGQKLLNTMPKVMGESMEISNRLITPRLSELMQDVMQGVANPK